MQIEALMAEPVVLVAAGLIGLALLALMFDAFSSKRSPVMRSRSPIVLMGDTGPRTAVLAARTREMPAIEPPHVHTHAFAPEPVADAQHPHSSTTVSFRKWVAQLMQGS